MIYVIIYIRTKQINLGGLNMKFALIHKLNGKVVTWTRQDKKAILQLVSDLIDSQEEAGATSFDLVLASDLKKKGA